MKVGDMVKFPREHRENPGTEYTEGWTGIIVEKVVDSSGVVEELYILWNHGKVSDYPSRWLSYEPFEVIS